MTTVQAGMLDHLRKIATPTRMMQEVAPSIMGRPYHVYPWLLYVEQRILAALNRPGRKILILSVPSQSGKTTYSGLALPCWYLGMNPNNQVLFITHGEEYSGQWGARCYNLLKQHGHGLFGIELSRQHAAVNNWRTAGGFGGMISTGILSGIVGNPGHLVVVDDVLASIEAATSPTILKKHWDEWSGTIGRRAQADTLFLITATRFNEEDLSGRLIEMSKAPGYDGPPVEVITIKAIAEPDDDDPLAGDPEWRDFLGRREGEAFEGQHDIGFYLETRSSLMASGQEQQWDAIYQANPGAAKNGMFPKDLWVFYRRSEVPRMVRRVRSWDLAATEGGGDWTVGTLMGRDAEDRFYVLDVQRQRWSASKVEKLVKDTAASDGYDVKVLIEQERAGAGKTVLEHYQRILLGHTVEAAKAETDKTSRARPYAAEQQKRNVYLEEGAPWLQEWMDEHKKMMGDGRMPRHDDQIDTGAYCMIDLLSNTGAAMYDPAEDESGAFLQDAQMRALLGESIFAR